MPTLTYDTAAEVAGPLGTSWVVDAEDFPYDSTEYGNPGHMCVRMNEPMFSYTPLTFYYP